MADDPDIKIVRFNNKELHIKRFRESQMVKNPSILMLGKRGNGKSWICRSILKYLSDIPCGIVIAPTERLTEEPFYEQFVPNTYIFYEFESEIIEKLLVRQDKMIDKAREKLKNENKIIDARTFILMDDCLSSKHEWSKSPAIYELLFNGRHYQISYILTSQTTMGPSSEIRNNFDYVFILANDSFNDLKKIYLYFASCFPNFESFRTVFGALTTDFCSMVVVNRGARAAFTDKIFWYKADNNMKDSDYIGCKKYVANHKKNYDEGWRKKNKMNFSNIEDMVKKKK